MPETTKTAEDKLMADIAEAMTGNPLSLESRDSPEPYRLPNNFNFMENGEDTQTAEARLMANINQAISESPLGAAQENSTQDLEQDLNPFDAFDELTSPTTETQETEPEPEEPDAFADYEQEQDSEPEPEPELEPESEQNTEIELEPEQDSDSEAGLSEELELEDVALPAPELEPITAEERLARELSGFADMAQEAEQDSDSEAESESEAEPESFGLGDLNLYDDDNDNLTEPETSLLNLEQDSDSDSDSESDSYAQPEQGLDLDSEAELESEPESESEGDEWDFSSLSEATSIIHEEDDDNDHEEISHEDSLPDLIGSNSEEPDEPEAESHLAPQEIYISPEPEQEAIEVMGIREKLAAKKNADGSSKSSAGIGGILLPLLLTGLLVVGGLILWQIWGLGSRLSAFSASDGFGGTSAISEAPASYEYAIDFILDGNIVARMAERGKAGWQVVGSRRTQDSTTGQYGYEFIFMRRTGR